MKTFSITAKLASLDGGLGCVLSPPLTGSARELSASDLKLALHESGFLMIRGFGFGVTEFMEISAAFGESFIAYLGGAQKRLSPISDDTIVAVNAPGETEPVSFHGEQYYKKVRPSTLWFFCERPPLSGGQTTVCDGVRVLRELSPETADLFRAKRVLYERAMSRETWRSLFQVDGTEDLHKICLAEDLRLELNPGDGSARMDYVTSAVTRTRRGEEAFVNSLLVILLDMQHLHPGIAKEQTLRVLFEDGSEIPPRVIDELKEVTDRLTIEIDWRPGDLLAIDNGWVMHGRRAFNDSNRLIYSRLSL